MHSKSVFKKRAVSLSRLMAGLICLASVYGALYFAGAGNLGGVGVFIYIFVFTNCYALFGRWQAHLYSGVPVEVMTGYEILEAVMKRAYMILALIGFVFIAFESLKNVLGD